MKYSPGFSILEMTLMVALFLTVLLGSALSLSSFLNQNHLDQYGEQIRQTLHRAQNRSVAGVENSSWGVHLDETAEQVTFFRGETYASRDPAFDDRLILPEDLDLRNTVLNGAAHEVVFNRITGETAQTGSFELQEKNTEETLTFNLNRYGQIELH